MDKKIIFEQKRDGKIVDYIDLTPSELLNWNALIMFMQNDFRKNIKNSWTYGALINGAYKKYKVPKNKISLATLRRMVLCLVLTGHVGIKQILRSRIIYLKKDTKQRWREKQ